MIALSALAWVVALAILTLAENRRHDRQRAELEARVVDLEAQVHTHPSIRQAVFDHETTVSRLLAGEHGRPGGAE